MNSGKSQISERLQHVRERVCRACRAAGRSADEVTVVCVTKYARIEDVAAVVCHGWYELGENRVQEAERKQTALRALLSSTALDRLRWHMIGHLQTNKASRAAAWAAMIQSIDSMRLARTVDRAADHLGRTVACLAQVNISHEAAKHGIAEEDAAAFISMLRELSHVRCAGIMGMAPAVDRPGESRPYFARLRRLWETVNQQLLARQQPVLPVLSMGMSHDFEVAIEEGATMVRIGTAIFGG